MLKEEVLLRQAIREILNEDLKNLGVKHDKTVAGTAVLRKMHNAPGVMDALMGIDTSKEIAHVLEALLDAIPVVRREAVLKALIKVLDHERKTLR